MRAATSVRSSTCWSPEARSSLSSSSRSSSTGAGGHLYYATNTGRDKQAIVRHGEGVLLETDWDLVCIGDPTGRRLLVIENADGYSRLELRDGQTLELEAEVPLPGRGVVEDAA